MRRILSPHSLTAGLLTACLLAAAPATAQEKRGLVYNVEGVEYSSRDEAQAALKAALDREVAKLPKAASHVPGKLLGLMPSHGQVLRTLGASIPRPDIADASALQVELNARANLDAVVRQELFDAADIQDSDSPQAPPPAGYDYVLSFQPKPDGKGLGWRMFRTANPGVVAAMADDLGPAPQRLPAFVAHVASVVGKLNAVSQGQPPAQGQQSGQQPGQQPGQPQPLPPGAVTTGTVFFVAPQGLALTNAHVVKGCQSMKVALPDGEAEAHAVETDGANDLALIKVPGRNGPLARFRAPPPVRQGEDAVVYGFPMAGALSTQGNLTTGIVSALTGLKDDSRYLQITAPVQHGNSGGPVLDGSGQVIGVVVSRMNTDAGGQIAQNVNFAIKSQIAQAFLDTNGVGYQAAAAKGRMNTADIGDLARSFTAMLVCKR